MPQIRIESLEDPRLNVFRSLKNTSQKQSKDYFIAEGVTVVERLFRSGFELHSVLVTDSKLDSFRQSIPEDATVYSVTKELASELVGYSFHRGVLAAGGRRNAPELEGTLPSSGASLVLVADRMIDQQNVGLLIRVAAGFGADALLLTSGSADPFSRRAIRVSMGNGFFLPIVELPLPGEDSMRTLSGLGYCCCAAALSEQAVELSSFQFRQRTALVFGNETHGICDSILAVCEHQLKIPMFNGTDSFNVAIAAGIFGYAYRASQLEREVGA